MTPPFPRTTCACPEDIANCKRQPGQCMPSDIPRIAEYLVEIGVTSEPEQVVDYLRATPGAVFGKLLADGQTIWTHRIPTISPATTDGHRCVFLTEEDRCRIHPVAPSGCAYHDVHQDAKEAFFRTTWIHAQIEASEAYADFRATLRPKETPCPSLP